MLFCGSSTKHIMCWFPWKQTCPWRTLYGLCFFLLCPGEYTGTTNDDDTFSLDDVYLYLGKRKLSLATAIDTELRVATSCALHFTTQKNLQKGDVITQSCSLDPHCCPVKTLVWLVLCHWNYVASKTILFDSSVPLVPYILRINGQK